MFPSLVELCGKGGPVASAGLYLAPLPTIRQISKKKTVGSLPLLPYSSMAGNTFIWAVYGLLKKEPKIWTCNVFGFMMAIYYCAIFIGNLGKNKSQDQNLLDVSTATLPGSVRQHAQAVIGGILGIFFLAILKPFGQYSETFIGNIGVTICVIMFASPLSVIKVVLETKSAKSIPLPFTVLTTINCFMWTVVGWFAMKDVNVYLPNGLGLASGIAQVVLKLVYGNNNDALPQTNSNSDAVSY
ncbi:sugar efflux transporter [Nitzschia inconspicua]|uniref:Sugar transporter SWEET1 n=1 Tax=Nitzschia inconspicua TaxID=303405 RepID=A0A9K3PDT6_9STRA|nr:sugar efflux transporter [Nitzschia inconspicua]